MKVRVLTVKRSEPLLRKWNCFDTLVVLLQWADYAAEMMPGKLVQSGNLGYLSAVRANLLQRFSAIFWQFRTTSDVPRNVFANAAPGAYHAFGTCHWLAKNRELKKQQQFCWRVLSFCIVLLETRCF